MLVAEMWKPKKCGGNILKLEKKNKTQENEG